MGNKIAITIVSQLTIKPIWDDIVVEGTATTGTIPAQAIVFSVSHTNFDTAYAALNTYLNTTVDVFANMTTTSTIVRADWDSYWEAYYNAKIEILNAIATATALLANWSTVNAWLNVYDFDAEEPPYT